MKPKIAIVILNWKQPRLTIETIDSLSKIVSPNFTYKIFLVDNGSPDNSYDIFNKTYQHNSHIQLLKSKTNLGFVDGNNYALSKINLDRYNYVLFLNNDVIVQPKFLKELVSFASDNPEYSLFGPKIYFAPGHEYHQDRYSKSEVGKVIWSAGGRIDWQNVYGSNYGIDEVDLGQHDKVRDDFDFLTGCCLMVSSRTLKTIGFFDSRYFMYLEDADLCQRAIRAGFKSAYVPQSVIWHINAGSSSAGGSLHDYFLTRNRLLFGFKFAPIRTKLALVKDSIRTLFTSPSSWQKKAVIDFYLGKYGKGSWT